MAEETMEGTGHGAREIPSHGHCYICGPENPRGMGLVWYERERGRVETELRLTREYQGPPGHVHGGASAAVLDEGMGKAVWRAGHQVLAANLNVDYRKPLPLEVAVRCVAWVERVEGRKVYTRGEIRGEDGTVVVEATGLYVSVPEFFHGPGGGWG